MASSSQSPGGKPTEGSKPIYLYKCYTCDAEVEDMKVHKKTCHPETYWCEKCQKDVKTDREVSHNERFHPGIFGMCEPTERYPVQKINFTQELEKMKGTRDDWVIVPKSKYEVLWDTKYNTAKLALEDLTAEDLEKKYDDRHHEWYQETGVPGVRCVDKDTYGELDPPMQIGHLAARANYRLSKSDTVDTFSLINGIPQKSTVNNGKVKRLEGHYRRLVHKWDDVIQGTGPIYDHRKTEPQPSQNGLEVYVPTGFFKIMKLRRKGEEPKVQAFHMDHSNVEFQSLLSMRSTVEEISKLTQLNLEIFENCEYSWDTGNEAHTCLKCLLTYSTQVELEKHSEIHEHYCGSCRRNFNSKGERDEHMRLHLNHPCDICERVFTTMIELNRHLEAHANDRNYPCSQCESSFNNQKHLDAHVQLVHEVELVECPIDDCEKMINKVKLTQHIRTVHCEEQYVCDKEDWCHKATKTKLNMIRHVNLVHDFVPKVKCPEPRCTRVFANMKAFQAHRKHDHKRKGKFPTSLNSTVMIDPETASKLIAGRSTAGNQTPGYLTMEEWMEKYSKSSPPTASATVTSGALEDLEDQESGVLNPSGTSPHHDLFSFSDDFEEAAEPSTSGTSGLSESQAAGISSILDTFNNYSLASQNSTPPVPSPSSLQISKPATEPTIVDITGDDDEEPTPVAVKVNRTSGATSVSGWVVLPPNPITKRKSTNTPASTKPTNKRRKKDDPAQRTLDNYFKH